MPVHAPSSAFIRLLQFIEGHREALVQAADLLGGPAACHCTLHLIEALAASSPRFPRRLRSELAALHRLLAFEGTAEPARSGAAGLTPIDPCDPAAEEICLLANGLAECLHDLAIEAADQEAAFTGVA